MLTLATTRERWSGLLGTFVVLCLGVALVSMTALALVSAKPSVPQRYAGAPVLVGSPVVTQDNSTFTEPRPWSAEATRALVDRLAALPGVAAAVPDRSFYAQAVIDGRPVGDPTAGEWRGHSWSSAALAPYRLSAGRPPARADEVALDHELGLPPGTRITLLTGAGPAPYTVSGTVDGPGFYLTDDAAGALAPGVRLIGLLPSPGADLAAVRAAAAAVVGGDGRVLAGSARAAAEPRYEAKLRWIGLQVLTAAAALSCFVSVLVVASTFAFSVAQRRRELGLLRTVGATPRQVGRMLYGEALTVGAVAAGSGVLVGAALAPVFGGVLVDAGLQPDTFVVRIHAWPLAATFGAGLGVALVGVWSAARRATRVPALAALREATVETRPMSRTRWLAGAVFTGAGLVLTALLAVADADTIVNYALLTAMALVIGLVLLGPAVIPPIVWAVCRPFARLRGATVLLVRQEAVTAVRRTASTAAPVLVTVAFAVAVSGVAQTGAGVYVMRQAAIAGAGVAVVPEGTPGLSDAAVAAAGGMSLLPTTGYGEHNVPIWIAGADRTTLALLDGNLTVRSGDLGALTGDDAAAVSTAAARRLGWRQGGTAPVTLPDGRRLPLRIVAVVDDAPTDVLVTRAAVRRHDPSALSEIVYLPDRHGGAGLGVAALATLGARPVDLATHATTIGDDEERLVQVFTLILIVLSAGYAAIAVANTLLMATRTRMRDFATLRLAGATPRQVLVTVAGEAGLVVGIGATLGLVVAATALLAIRSAFTEIVGAPVPLAVPWPVILAVVTACLLLALAATVLPVARSAFRRPAAAGAAAR